MRSRDATLLLDPLAPPPSAREVWDRIETLAPETVVVLKPDHVRDVDLFVRWYGAAAYGPQLFWRDDVPETKLRVLNPGDELPGGLRAYHDGRGLLETRSGSQRLKRRVSLRQATASGAESRSVPSPTAPASGPLRRLSELLLLARL